MQQDIIDVKGGCAVEWVDRMNAVIDYVENNLWGEISSSEISKIMASPYTVFQCAFVQITGIPLSEYIRRRKLGVKTLYPWDFALALVTMAAMIICADLNMTVME